MAYGSEGTTPGTRAASIAKSFGHFRSDVRFPDAKVDVRRLYTFGVGRQWKRIQPGAIQRVGKLPIVPTSPEVLSYAFGADNAAGTGPTTHTVSLANRAILPTFSWAALMVDDAGTRPFQRVFLGCVIDELALSVRQGEELHADLTVLALNVEDYNESPPVGTPFSASPPNYGYPAVNGFTDQAGRPYMWHDSIVTIAGTPVARCEGMQMGLKNNHSVKRYLVDGSGRNPQEHLTGRPDFALNFDFVPAGFLSSHTGTYDFVNDGVGAPVATREALYDLLEGGTFFDVTIKLVKGTAPEDSLQLTFGNCQLVDAPHDFRIDGNETVVSAQVEPRVISMTTKDAITTAYVPYTT